MKVIQELMRHASSRSTLEIQARRNRGWCAPGPKFCLVGSDTAAQTDVSRRFAPENHPLLAGNLTFAGGIERSVANLDLTLSFVMADDQAIWRDAGPSQLERMRRRAVKYGAPGAIPTRDLPLRRRTLYAAELREHKCEEC